MNERYYIFILQIQHLFDLPSLFLSDITLLASFLHHFNLSPWDGFPSHEKNSTTSGKLWIHCNLSPNFALLFYLFNPHARQWVLQNFTTKEAKLLQKWPLVSVGRPASCRPPHSLGTWLRLGWWSTTCPATPAPPVRPDNRGVACQNCTTTSHVLQK